MTKREAKRKACKYMAQLIQIRLWGYLPFWGEGPVKEALKELHAEMLRRSVVQKRTKKPCLPVPAGREGTDEILLPGTVHLPVE